jgi:hypothetical protein
VKRDPKSVAFSLRAEKHSEHIRQQKYKWTLARKSDSAELWSYSRKNDAEVGPVKPEALCGPDGRAVAAKFTHGNGGGAAVDKLAFTLSDDQRYEWRFNHPISTVGGYRYDFQRYALFRVAGAGLQLVADDAP